MRLIRRFRPARMLLAAVLASGWAGPAQALHQLPPPQAEDRIAIIAPHPDDEVLATSGLIQQAVAVGAQVKVIYLTNGDHNQANFRLFNWRRHDAADRLALGEQRRAEAVAAMRLLGVPAEDLTFLGYPDWSMLRLWQDYWEADEVLYNNATHSTGVPYPEDFGYQHLYRAENLTADLYAVLREFKPTRVFTTHPCDTNPDHRATANFVQLAVLQLAADGLRPALEFFVVHFRNWPAPLQYRPALTLEPPPALRDNDWQTLPLTPAQVQRKYQATLTNQTQTVNHRAFLTAFARANELFADGQPPTIPFLPAQAPWDWTKAAQLRALAVLPAEAGYETNGIATRPPAPTVLDLDRIAFLQQDDTLITQVQFANPHGRPGGVRWYLFGYKHGTAFTDLPKVQITILPDRRLQVLVNHIAIEDSDVTLTNVDGQMLVRIPLELLGDTKLDYLFTAALAYNGALIADDTAWHLLRLQPATKD